MHSTAIIFYEEVQQSNIHAKMQKLSNRSETDEEYSNVVIDYTINWFAWAYIYNTIYILYISIKSGFNVRIHSTGCSI